MWIDPKIIKSFEQSATDIHRVYSSPLGWIERYGQDFVLVLNEEKQKERLLEDLLSWCCSQGFACKRVFLKKRYAKNEKSLSNRLHLIHGRSDLPMRTVCRENGLLYSIRFDQGGSAGLFMDQRQNRMFLRKRKVDRLLNLFAFSCSFGLCAALGGAESWNVDLSQGCLEWGKDNFRLNGLDPAAHKFWAMDVREALKIFTKKGIIFDHVVIDPPTFSYGKDSGEFSIVRDLDSLLEKVFGLCSKQKATLFLSTNYKRWNTKDLFLKAKRVAWAKSIRVNFLHYPVSLPDIPQNELPASCWIEVGSP
ncbi:class I SAM-dependent methyltransferase [Methylacidiphilum caldifontis]|uniref:Methyltransferase n=1 Tax=Methylacidiphilum caldifontis TaxID=2795386 RepID=A0A4Y8PHI2_9BACT|nr:class I SAM-dependent methyltransferase [Methylacidiphilum caldifontis]QSR89666.1 class I SAM-dependent methyltransferase [Methylacidiphilum caldifontis]TFE73425.1 methyltransferase [Methylacidiphilum caldifontis]